MVAAPPPGAMDLGRSVLVLHPTALVACLHRHRRMREAILPPPPSTRLAVWATLNVLWFRVVNSLVHRIGAAVRAARLPPPPRPAASIEPRLRSVVRLPPAPRFERPTAVEVRRLV